MQKKQPLVSINLPTYNHEDYIAECLDSLLGQTYKNIEILVMDDKSQDNTLQIAQEYAKKHPDIVKIYPNQKNQGIPKNFDRGYQLAKGEYYINFNSDDVMLPENIEKQVALLEANPEAPLCYANTIYFNSQTGRVIKNKHKNPPKENSFRRAMPGSNMCATAVVMRKSMMPDAIREETGVACDWTLFIECLQHGEALYIHKPLVRYRIHDTNVSSNVQLHIDSLKVLDYVKKHLKVPVEIWFGYGRKRRILAKHLWRRGFKLKAIPQFFLGLWDYLVYIILSGGKGLKLIYWVETKQT